MHLTLLISTLKHRYSYAVFKKVVSMRWSMEYPRAPGDEQHTVSENKITLYYESKNGYHRCLRQYYGDESIDLALQGRRLAAERLYFCEEATRAILPERNSKLVDFWDENRDPLGADVLGCHLHFTL